MGKTVQLRELESRQVELLSVMQKSDAHALKCTKLGLSFAEEYPEEAAEYAEVREEYNLNQERIEAIQSEIAREEKDANEHIDDLTIEVNNE